MSPPTVACIGDVNIDLITTPVKRVVPEEAEDVVFTERVGGNAANTAVAVARLGLDALLVGRIGSDHWGQRLRRMLDGYSVDTALTKVPGRTALTVCVTFEKGHRSFLGDQGETNETLEASDVPPKALDAAYVLRAGYWYTPGLLGTPTAELFSAARDRGTTTLLDIGWDHLGWTAERLAGLYHVLEHTDVLFVNEAEARHVARVHEGNVEEAARAILEKGVGAVVLHLGPGGSRLISSSEDVAAEALRAGRTVDPTGTGDVFNGAFITAHHSGLATNKILGFANAAAAEHLAGNSFPTRERVEARLARRLQI